MCDSSVMGNILGTMTTIPLKGRKGVSTELLYWSGKLTYLFPWKQNSILLYFVWYHPLGFHCVHLHRRRQELYLPRNMYQLPHLWTFLLQHKTLGLQCLQMRFEYWWSGDTSICYIDKSVFVVNRLLVKFMRNYTRDSSGVFSISSLVRLSMTSFPTPTVLLVEKHPCLYNKKKITRWLEDMNFIFSS